MTATLDDILIYPIKSTAGLRVHQSEVKAAGLEFDRQLAVFDRDNQVMTAREYPQLLALTFQCQSSSLKVFRHDELVFETSLFARRDRDDECAVSVFRAAAFGAEASEQGSRWLSDYLGERCRLLALSPHRPRAVQEEHGGRVGDTVSFADECPILLIGEASLLDLNSRLEQAVSMANFRPNFVVSGWPAYAEDRMTQLQIGEVIFDVAQPCLRCELITVDPVLRTRHPKQEPLRTLARYRDRVRGKVPFGVHLIPRGTGSVRVGDVIQQTG